CPRYRSQSRNRKESLTLRDGQVARGHEGLSMSAASNDRELEEALVGTAQLRQRYRAASQDEPPDALDALIRAAAREETAAGPRHAAARRVAGWRVPLSIAAIVVVSATVSVLVAERHGKLPLDADHSRNERVSPAASKDDKQSEPETLRRQVPDALAD